MNCPECGKVLAITKILQPINDTVICSYCTHAIPSEDIVWKSDGKFHFNILGDVVADNCNVAPRLLLEEQTIKVLDIRRIRATAIRIIRREPNYRCICSEFFIEDKDIRIDILQEIK